MKPQRLCALAVAVFVLGGCGGGGGGGGGAAPLHVPASPATADTTLKAAKSSSPYAGVLVDCVSEEYVHQSCALSRLPLIGQDFTDPTVEDILSRLVVSHDWMAIRFEQLLGVLPDDILQMMRSLTAIVIADDIRPSYYLFGTGAMYLDPQDLWLTAAERATVSTAADPRSSFDDELGFVSVWRYVENFSYAWSNSSSAPRSLADIELPMAALLFHELAHANDFFPISEFSLLQQNLSVYSNSGALESRRSSNNLQRPGSVILRDLGQVMFFGETPDQIQKNLTPIDVAIEFDNDIANELYSYSNQYEDFAMLVEELMMLHHYGIERDVGFTNRPVSSNPSRSDYILAWGMRQRIADLLVTPRSEYAMQLLLDRSDVSAYMDSIANPLLLDTGVSWDISILSGSSLPVGLGKTEAAEETNTFSPMRAAFDPGLPFGPSH